jgi:hypothetical protein
MKCLAMVTLVLTLVLVSTGVGAITITYYGQVTQGGTPLESIVQNPVLLDYENLGIAPLVQLWKVNPIGVDTLLHETTVGAGQYQQPVDGRWIKAVTISATMGEKIYVKAYAGSTDNSLSVTSDEQWIKSISGGFPPDYIYDFGVLDIPIPEPSVILLASVLLLTRKSS